MARDIYPPALSKTAKYKKITKPLLERKRRARINRCLDELKDLMVGALEIDDENISKLEKADILELTVNHLTKLHTPKDPVEEAKKFQAGFGQCAAEACRYILSVPGLDGQVSECLVNHLSRLVSTEPLTVQVPGKRPFSPPVSPPSPQNMQKCTSDLDRSSSEPEEELHQDNVSQFSVSTNASYRLKSTPAAQELMSPMTGLLTTVDRISNQYYHNENYQHHNARQPESKDEILAKIRQHIMYKRGNEAVERIDPPRSVEDISNNRANVIKENEYSNSKRSLDLRKVRTSSRPNNDDSNKLPVVSTAENIERNDSSLFVPSKKEIPFDYNNLPPKKKRKLIEYQEMLRREEELKKSDPAWRPW